MGPEFPTLLVVMALELVLLAVGTSVTLRRSTWQFQCMMGASITLTAASSAMPGMYGTAVGYAAVLVVAPGFIWAWRGTRQDRADVAALEAKLRDQLQRFAGDIS